MKMNDETQVVITDIRMPFGSMVTFMVKLAIAAIPVAIFLVSIPLIIWMLIEITGQW